MSFDLRRFALSTLRIGLFRALLLGFLALAALAGQTRAAITFVQVNSATPQTPQTSLSVVYKSAQTAGNFNVVIVGWNDSTATVSSVVDSKGNAYTLAVGPTVQSGTASQSIYYATNIAAAAANGNTVTVTFSPAAAFPDIRIAEYSGVATVSPFDVGVGAQGSSTSSSSGSVTTTNANDLLIGANTIQTGTTGAGSGYTSRIITPQDADILEDRVVTATGSYSATAPVAPSGKWVMQMAAFKAASSGGSGPNISSLSPTSGAVGTSVTITGTNFGTTTGTVTFNGTAGTPTSWSPTSVVVPVPTGATTGPVVITVSGTASNGVTFTVAPSISSLTPTSGPVGTSVTIAGANFGSTTGTVTFNGTAATPTSWSSTSIVVPVPSAATSGSVVVTTSGGLASNSVNFSVTPKITSLTPNSGAVGTAITIAGTTFGTSAGSVSFNGTAATPTSWSSTSIVVPVPAGATTGAVVVTTAAGLASNGVTFSVAPNIASLTPSSGSVGTAVTIAGSNFGSTAGTVSFNGTAATPTSWGASSVVVNVPTGATTGPVVLTTSAGLASNGVTFTVAPVLTTLTPSSGPINTSVTIAGSNFGSTTGSVTFNGTAATPTSWSNTSIVVAVPSAATTGAVVVTTAGGLASNGVNFSVTPNIASLTPNSGAVGTAVTIAGTTFGASAGTVSFNGTAATPTSWSATSIVVNVPTGATSGSVVVTTSAGLASNGVTFTVAPVISTLTPNSGPVNTSVTIAGSNFGSTTGSLTFNGVAATPTSWSNTSVVVPVPSTATTGPVIVTTAGGLSSSGVTFTVTAGPNITSLTPTSGPVGTTVTIAGTGFGSSTGTVTFNGTAATPTSWSSTSVSVAVPAGATTGPVVVTTSGGQASNGVTFTVTVVTPIAFVQVNAATPQGGQTSTAVAFKSAQTAGNFNVVVVGWNDSTATVNSVTDTKGNSYVLAVGPTVQSGSASQSIYYATNIAAAAANGNTVTVTFNSAANAPDVRIAEYSGIATTSPVDVTAAAQGNSSTTSSGSATTTNPNDLLIGANIVQTGVTAAGTGFTSRIITNPDADILEDRIVNATGSYSATAPVSPSGQWVMQMVAFKGASGSGGNSPNISSLTPSSGAPGTSVTIAGSNFGTTTGTVTFNNTPATPTSWGASTIVAPVPSGATSGPVVVTTSGGAASNGVSFTVTAPAPQINSLTPNTGTLGTSVTIAGANFGSSTGTVTFNGVAGTPTSWSASSIVVPVPNGATTGPVVVTAGGQASNGVTFTVTSPGPSITNLNPLSGPANTSVTITGSNFGSTAGSVTFNGVAATPSSWSSTTIVAPVPTGATTGPVIITVNGVASNPVTFTVVAGGPIAYIQGNFAVPHPSASTVTITYTLAQLRGDLNVVVVGWNDSTSQVTSVTDSSGNAYQLAVGPTVQVGVGAQSIYYAKNIAAAAANANVVTVTFNVAANAPDIRIAEYSNIDPANPIDNVAAGQNDGTLSDSGPMTTNNASDLLVAANLVASGTTGPGTGFTSRIITSPDGDILEDQIVASTGTYDGTAPISPLDEYIMQVVAFRAAGSPAPPPISVSLVPTTTSTATGYGTQAFQASVANDTLGKGVTFALSGPGCAGSACGALSRATATSVLYTAPPALPSPATVTLTATSVVDTTKNASATITVTQGSPHVTITPGRGSTTFSQSVQFAAAVFNDSQNTTNSVTWAVDSVTGGNSTTGTISTGGLFTPGTQAGLHNITATDTANVSVATTISFAVSDLAGVYTHHNDVQRTGQNLKEYALSPSTVSSATFGQLFSCVVDGYVFAEPLYVPNLSIAGGTHNVVYITTMHDSVYAFDADSPSCVQYWHTNFLGTGVTTMPWLDTASPGFQAVDDVVPEIGALSTPVIDPTTNTIYVVAKTKETVGTGCSVSSPCYIHRLHALDIVAGTEKFGGPVVISASGFVSLRQMQRPALLLANGNIYIGFGSHGDNQPYQGWMFGFNASTLAQVFNFPTTVTTASNQGAVWQGGSGPALDASGNIYFSTGNGLWDGTKNYSDSTLKLSSTGALLDYFTPFDQAIFDTNDIDLASAGVIVLPTAVGSSAHPNLLLATGKVGILYLLDQTNLGKFNSTANNDVQEVVPSPPPNTTNFNGGMFGVPAYWNGNIYVTGVGLNLLQYPIANGALAALANSTSSNVFPLRGATPAVSANGTTNGIVWVLDLTGWQNSLPAILDAYNATNLGDMLFTSPASGAGAAGQTVKFTVPMVANGRVYVGGEAVFTVYGLLP